MSWLSNSLFGGVKTINTDFSGMDKLAQSYMNPFSANNQNVLRGLTNQATDITAQQGINNNRAQAMGMNPFADQQNQNLISQVIKNAGGGWNEWLNNANNIGPGLVQNKYNMQFQKDMANAKMYNQRQKEISDFMQGFLGQGASALSGPVGNLAGSFMNWLV